MASIREFVFSLMVISISCAAVNMLAPDNSSVSRYVKFLVALIVTVVLLSPLQSVLGIIPELVTKDVDIDFSYSEAKVMTYAESIIKETCENMESELSLMINERFSVCPVDISVYCDSQDIENVTIEKVTVIYDKENKLLFSDTARYVEAIVGCKCEVIAVDEGP